MPSCCSRKGRVSDVQRRMMTTATEPNVHAVAIEGTFDDCQALVKAMFNDLAFRDRVRLAGVNSINWARVVAQVTYYFVAATALGSPHRPVAFSVPTGNFGDIFAGYAAKRMGLPIERLVIATNDNDILRRARTPPASTRCAGVVATTSPSMDIQVSSNFERYLFEASGRDAACVRGKMGGLRRVRPLRARRRRSCPMRDDFDRRARRPGRRSPTASARVKRERLPARPAYAPAASSPREKTLARPGTAPHIVLATAHPAKFPDAMQAITGERAGPAAAARLADDATRSASPCCPTISPPSSASSTSAPAARKQGAAA